MKSSDTPRILELLAELSESINGPRPKGPGPKARRPLSDRIDDLDRKVGKLDTRVNEVRLGLVTLAADTRGQFREIDERFNKVDARFAAVDTQFQKIDAQFQKVDTQFQKIDARFQQIDARFQQIDARFQQVDARFHKVDARFHKVDARFDAVDLQFNKVNRNITVLRVELVDHMERIHSELTGRIVDLDTPGTEGRGGSGSGSGGSGVPLAS